MGSIAIDHLPDGRLVLWVVGPNSQLFSAWKTSPQVNSGWSALTAFEPDAGQVNDLAVGTLPDGRLTLWVVGSDQGLKSTWKVSPDPNAAWQPWSAFNPDPGQPLWSVTAGRLPNGELQLFATTHPEPDQFDHVLTCWKANPDPNAPWTLWQQPFPADHAGLLSGNMAAGALPDGRLVLWIAPRTGRLLSAWKTSQQVNSGWSALTAFEPDAGQVNDLAVGTLPDGRLTLWVVGSDQGLKSTWKVSPDPNAAWQPWSTFSPDPGQVNPGQVRSVAVGRLPNGELQLFVMGDGFGIYTCWKASPDPNARWTPWSKFAQL